MRWFSEQQPADPGEPIPLEPVEEEGESKPFVEHLEDLRKVLFRILGVLFVTFNLCLVFANRLLQLLEWPLLRVAPEHSERLLQSLNVTDSFVLAMKMSFYGGVLLAAPLLLYLVSQFILPALKQREKSVLVPVCVFGTLLFLAGVALCYFWIIPQTLKAFIKYSEWMNIEPHWTVTSYIEFVTQFMLAMGLTFEVPLVMLILVRIGILSAGSLRRGRKVCIAIAVIISAIVAPPDPLSMLLMSLPLIALFELTIWVAWMMERKARAS